MSSPQSEQLRALLRSRKSAPLPRTWAERRANLEAPFRELPLPPGTVVEPLEVAGVKAEWVSASTASRDRVFLYLHGGAYVAGSFTSHRELVARISAASGASGLILDYRLAPENPFPAGLEDAHRGYNWLREQGFSPSRIIIAGDSAGGGLATALLVSLRDANQPLPAGAVLISPWVDLTGTSESITRLNELDPSLNQTSLASAAAAYAGEHPLAHPLISPLNANLEGLPPLFIQVGDSEILLDEALALAQKAEAVQVRVELEVWEEMWHVFQIFAFTLPEGQQAVEKIGQFMRERTGTPTRKV